MRINLTILLIVVLFPNVALSAFVLDSTRYVYLEGEGIIQVGISNKGDNMYAGVVNVKVADKYSSEHAPVVVPTPPVFKLGPDKVQKVRLKMLNETKLPRDRESLFWLALQEIPISNKEVGNALTISQNTKVKLFYRPNDLNQPRYKAEESIEYRVLGENIYFFNPTPYYFSVLKIEPEASEENIIPDELTHEMSIFAPNKKIQWRIDRKHNISSFKIYAIDDWGAVRTYSIKSKG